MQIYPIQVPTVDWTTYIKVCQDILGHSPTRGIDDLGIKTTSPAAFVHTLGFCNTPRIDIKRVEFYEHTFLSFICVLDIDEEEIITRFLRIPSVKEEGHRKSLALYSATLFDWFNHITLFSDRNVHRSVREFLNIIMTHIERAGFSEIFSKYERLQLNDGTFTLVCK